MSVVLPTDVDFQIPADGKYVSLVRKGIRSVAAGSGFDDVECQDIEVAIGEAVTNAICHGQPLTDCAYVHIHCRLTPNRLVVEVRDEGRATCVPTPRSLPDESNEHGRGWVLIHRLMDRVSIRCSSKGLVVRMVKRRHHQRFHKSMTGGAGMAVVA